MIFDFQRAHRFVAMTVSQRARIAVLSKLVVSLSILFSLVSAYAGDRLHFKSGSVDARQTLQAQRGLGAPNQKSHFVVQFKNTISASDKRSLEKLGAHIVRYVPDDAYIVEASSAAIHAVAKSSLALQAVVPMQSSWKIAAEFAPGNVFNRSMRQEVLVQLFPQTIISESSGKILEQITALPGVSVRAVSDRAIVAQVPFAQLENLARLSGVEWVQPNGQFQPLYFDALENGETAARAGGNYSDLTGHEAGTKLMSFAPVWARGLNGRGQIGAMADTGHDNGNIATIHQDFTGRIPVGFSFGMFAKSWEDPMGHGTHVAGSVLGDGRASGGALRGGAYGAEFVPQGMWSPVLKNLTVPPKLADLFTKASGAGARVHTNSWGSAQSLGAYDGFAQQVDDYTAANPEMLIIFAAGNSGVDGDKDGRVDPNSIGSPGTAKNVLTVGASKNLVMNGGLQKKLSETRLKDSWPTEPLASSMMSENSQGLAAFSSRGPTADGRLKPEVVAPGTNILSVRSQHKDAEPLWGIYNQDYVWSGGTSMATPLVAGAALVVRQYVIDELKMSRPSAALIKAVLMHTAVDLFPGQFGEVGKARGQELLSRRPNNDEGYGRVDVDRATMLAGTTLIDEQRGLASGETKVHSFRVERSGRLTATLVYTDAAAAAGSAKALVNDLDLVLVDASGQQITLNDRINNNEFIERDVKPGNYELRVKGQNVPQGISGGRQPYALVISY